MRRDEMPKIGCVGHDCATCKASARATKRTARETAEFVAFVYSIMNWLDREFANAPRSPQTKRIADNTVRIENAADLFAVTTLKLPFKQIDKLKRSKVKS